MAMYAISPDRMRRFGNGHTLAYKVAPEQKPFSPQQVLSGVTRPHRATNLWISDASQPLPQWLELAWPEPQLLREVQLVFPGHLVREYHAYGPFYRDPQCPRDYAIDCWVNGNWARVLDVGTTINACAGQGCRCQSRRIGSVSLSPPPTAILPRRSTKSDVMPDRSQIMIMRLVLITFTTLLFTGFNLSAEYPVNRPARKTPAAAEGAYTVRPDQPKQVIWGFGFEIQSDSIVLFCNIGLPKSHDECAAIPTRALRAGAVLPGNVEGFPLLPARGWVVFGVAWIRNRSSCKGAGRSKCWSGARWLRPRELKVCLWSIGHPHRSGRPTALMLARTS